MWGPDPADPAQGYPTPVLSPVYAVTAEQPLHRIPAAAHLQFSCAWPNTHCSTEPALLTRECHELISHVRYHAGEEQAHKGKHTRPPAQPGITYTWPRRMAKAMGKSSGNTQRRERQELCQRKQRQQSALVSLPFSRDTRTQQKVFLEQQSGSDFSQDSCPLSLDLHIPDCLALLWTQAENWAIPSSRWS